jgi:hypothetical protein
MKENKTSSILQRLPVILAVTAASYGLQAHAARAVDVKAAAGTSSAAHADRAASAHRT